MKRRRGREFDVGGNKDQNKNLVPERAGGEPPPLRYEF